MEISVRTNAPDLARQFRHLAHREMAWAMKEALNLTAFDAARDLRTGMRRVFKIRSHRVPQAIRVVPATKEQWPRPRAAFGVINQGDAFLAGHALGQVRRPKSGGRAIAVPTSLVKRTRGGKVPVRQLPKSILARPTGFIESGRIRARNSSKVVRGVRTPIFFTLHSQVRIKKRWPFLRDARSAAVRAFPGHFRRALIVAVNRTQTKLPARLPKHGPFPVQ